MTVIEPDPLLLASGAQILSELFPGMLADLVAARVPVPGDFRELWFSVGGHLLCRDGEPDDLAYLVSPPYLEGQVRRRVQALSKVSIEDRCEVTGLAAAPALDYLLALRRDGRAAVTVFVDSPKGLAVLEAARSAESGLGRVTWRRSTITSWRSTRGHRRESEAAAAERCAVTGARARREGALPARRPATAFRTDVPRAARNAS